MQYLNSLSNLGKRRDVLRLICKMGASTLRRKMRTLPFDYLIIATKAAIPPHVFWQFHNQYTQVR